MALAETMTKLKTGFSRTFWVGNGLELLERLAYYGSKAILFVYVSEHLVLGPDKAGWLVGSVFNTLLYLLPVLAGTIVDRYGFKKSLLICFSIFCVGYFLIGLAGLPAGKAITDSIGTTTYMLIALIITAAGGSLIKPSIVGTVARTTTEETKSLGYSIYYMLVNLGGAIGPLLALPVRQNIGIAYVLMMSSLTSFVLVILTLLFFKEPPRPADAPPPKSMGAVLKDMVMVFGNGRFMAFLLIFSGFWLMFWQIFYALPVYVKDILKYEKFEIIETVDAFTIILLVTPLTALANKLKPIAAMTLGFALASASWFLMGSKASLTITVVAIVMFAFGEAIQAPRYYAYVADLAPKEQVGTYMGFAFLPVALGTFGAGILAGWLVRTYITSGHPNPPRMWFVVGMIGVVSTLLMLAYDKLVAKKTA